MKDRAVVLSVEGPLAWVRVKPQAVCGECAAKHLCLGRQDAAGLLAVRNPLDAQPGDEVEIEVPEAHYQRDMTRIFSVLLASSVAGFGVGYIARPVGFLGLDANALVGLLIGILAAGAGLLRYYRKQQKEAGLPVIVDILACGGAHGKA